VVQLRPTRAVLKLDRAAVCRVCRGAWAVELEDADAAAVWVKSRRMCALGEEMMMEALEARVVRVLDVACHALRGHAMLSKLQPSSCASSSQHQLQFIQDATRSHKQRRCQHRNVIEVVVKEFSDSSRTSVDRSSGHRRTNACSPTASPSQFGSLGGFHKFDGCFRIQRKTHQHCVIACARCIQSENR
jgi:hypothetical protein